MERGPSFEFENLPSGESENSKEQEPAFKQEREIIAVKEKPESEQPLSRPEDIIENSEEMRGRVKSEKERAAEKGTVGPVIFAYASGLSLEFNPVFDGQPSLETFTGLYSGNFVVPQKYDKTRQQDMDSEAVEQRLAAPAKRMPLQPRILEPTLSEPAKRKLSYQQNVQMLLSDRFSVGYDDLTRQWVVSVDSEAIKDSERNVFAIFHEFGHIPYLALEDELLPAAFEKPVKIAGKSIDDVYDEFAKGSSEYIASIRGDLEKLDPELMAQIQSDVEGSVKYKSGEPYRVNKASSVLRRHQKQINGPSEGSEQESLQPILVKLSIFAERMADARAAVLARQLRKEKNGSVDLDFSSLDTMKSFYHQALESYAQTHKEPRFRTGLRG